MGVESGATDYLRAFTESELRDMISAARQEITDIERRKDRAERELRRREVTTSQR